MANEVTTSAFSDVTYAEIIEKDMQLELRPHRIFRPWLRQGEMGPSTAYSFTYLDDSGATTYAYTEGTTDFIAGTLTAQTTTASNATAAVTGIATLVTDLAQAVSVVDVRNTVGAAMGRHMAEAYDVAAQAVIDNASNTTGGATTNTIARMLSVISALEQRDVGSRGERLVGGIHSKQLGDLRADVVSLTSTFLAGKDAQVGDILMKSLDGYVGDPFGVPVFHSTSISNASGAYIGWIMAANSAVGAYELVHPDGGRWLERVGIQRDESKVANEVIVTSANGFALIDNNRLQGWKSTT